MSKASRSVCLVLIVASVGSVQWTGPASGKSLYGSSAYDAQATELRRVYKSAYALVAEGKYLQAEDLFQQLFAQFKALGDLPMAGRCLIGGWRSIPLISVSGRPQYLSAGASPRGGR
jgi:hypothetical protein